MSGTPGSNSESPEGRTTRPVPSNGSIWWACAICSTGAVLFFYLQHQLAGIASEICLHIATAFLVALILLVALEFKAKRAAHHEMVLYREMVAKDVFGAVLERMIPAPLFAELVSLMGTDVIKEDCAYSITLKKPKGVALRGKMLIERKTTFTLRNLASHKTDFVLRSEAPVHQELKINNQNIDLEEGKNLTRVTRNGRDTMLLEVRIPLEANGTASVYLAGLEPKPIEADLTNYIQRTAILGLRVLLRNEYTEKLSDPEIEMIHPARDKLVPDEFGFYHFERAILPGQGFTVTWRLKKERETPSAPAKGSVSAEVANKMTDTARLETI